MINRNFRTPANLGSQNLIQEILRLQGYQLAISDNRHLPSSNQPSLKDVDRAKTIAELANNIAKRASGAMAFKKRYYPIFSGWIFDRVRKNTANNFRGIVASKRWRAFYNGLGEIGGALSLLGIPMKAAELSWRDLSADTIAVNSTVTMSQWSAETVALSVAQPLQLGAEFASWGAAKVGLTETSRDIKVFAIQLEGSINETKEIISQVCSVQNVQDLFTWDTSVANPDNWQALANGVSERFDSLVTEAQPLYEDITAGIGDWFSRNF